MGVSFQSGSFSWTNPHRDLLASSCEYTGNAMTDIEDICERLKPENTDQECDPTAELVKETSHS